MKEKFKLKWTYRPEDGVCLAKGLHGFSFTYRTQNNAYPNSGLVIHLPGNHCIHDQAISVNTCAHVAQNFHDAICEIAESKEGA